MIISMAKEYKHGSMAVDIKDFTKTVRKMEKANIYGKIAAFLTGSGRIIKSMGRECIAGQMAESIEEVG
jgi:hypothetical protein